MKKASLKRKGSVGELGKSCEPLTPMKKSASFTRNLSLRTRKFGVTYPITPSEALKYLKQPLPQHEIRELFSYRAIFFIGILEKSEDIYLGERNNGYDDAQKDFILIRGDHIGFRFEVTDLLGRGSFGIVAKCFDHKRKEFVALKAIKNSKLFRAQAEIEVSVLKKIRFYDANEASNIVRIKQSFDFRGHIFIAFELLSNSLSDLLKYTLGNGISIVLIRAFAKQLLTSLAFLKEKKIIHCDLKPENILLSSPAKAQIKLIDFGSSCPVNSVMHTYIQSRFYRAPEILFGIPYGHAIDMWSFGCILAEFCIGIPLFVSRDEQELLEIMVDLLGLPPEPVMKQAALKIEIATSRKGLVDEPLGGHRGKLLKRLACSGNLADLVMRCLDWNARSRITPKCALSHAFFQGKRRMVRRKRGKSI